MMPNRSKKNPMSLTFTLLLFTTWLASISTASAQDADKPNLLIDLSNPGNNTVTVAESGNLKLLIINMIPSQVDNYYVQVDAITYMPVELAAVDVIRKRISEIRKDQDAAVAAGGQALADCTLDEKIIDNINNAGTSQLVAAAIAVAALTQSGAEIKSAACDVYEERLALAIAKTKRFANVTVNQDYDAKVTVSLNDTKTILSTTHIQPIRKQWITSYGFGFVDNRDKNYYSKGNSTDGYVIAKQEAREDFSYSALAIFTYPYSTNKNGFEWGFSGGIGASQENVAAMAGISLVVNKNFIITGGVTFQEFTILKGQYNEGQNIGAAPIDSNVLEDQTYKASPLIVLSYRFGAGGSGNP